jgi:hypothetical protein
MGLERGEAGLRGTGEGIRMALKGSVSTGMAWKRRVLTEDVEEQGVEGDGIEGRLITEEWIAPGICSHHP